MMLAELLVLTNLAFVAAFDTETRCPSWVAYDLDPAEIVVTNRLAVPVVADPRVPESDNVADYVGSGYDRGHLAPAADFNFSEDALRETYRFTNIAPQLPTFNRGEWANVEAEVRRLGRGGRVHVLTYLEFDPLVTNRIGRVRVPSAFVKVAHGWFGVRQWRVSNVLEVSR